MDLCVRVSYQVMSLFVLQCYCLHNILGLGRASSHPDSFRKIAFWTLMGFQNSISSNEHTAATI